MTSLAAREALLPYFEDCTPCQPGRYARRAQYRVEFAGYVVSTIIGGKMYYGDGHDTYTVKLDEVDVQSVGVFKRLNPLLGET